MQRITFFKDNFGNAVNFDLEKIASFCRDYANAPKHLGNWSYHKYYQFMRPLGLKFGLTGAIECIFPKFYSALTAKKRHERGL